MKHDTHYIIISILTLLSLLGYSTAHADEGQWQPHQIELLQSQFDRLGLELSAKQVADLNQYPLNAVIGLGYCSASFVSPNGLVLTNHHCAYGAIQYNTTPEHNRARDGFLAKDRSQELSAGPQERLYITEEVTNVTQQILGEIDPDISGKEYYDAIQDKRKQLIKACENHKNYRCNVRAFHHGKEYFLLKSLMIKDVRLVYAPSESIGNYGGDIDNFEYPRHTGDFTLFRAYVDKDGTPSAYHPDNRPYQPSSYLTINATGVKQGEGIILAGTPGRTSRYKLATEVKFAADWRYPTQVAQYRQRLAVIDQATQGDENAKMAYSSQVKSINNRLKKRQGLLDGFKKTDIFSIKHHQEQELLKWINADPSRAKYATAHQQLSQLVKQKQQLDQQAFYSQQALDSALYQVASQLYRLAKEREKPDAQRKIGYQERDLPMRSARLKRMDKRFVAAVDQQIWEHFLNQYQQQPQERRIAKLDKALGLTSPQPQLTSQITNRYYQGTQLHQAAVRLAWMEKPAQAFEQSTDPFIQLAVKNYPLQLEIEHEEQELDGAFAKIIPEYMQAIIAYNHFIGKLVYPDANGTLRVSIGMVDGYPAADAIYKTPFTSLGGMLVKNTDKYPFNLPDKIKRASLQAPASRYWQKQLDKDKTFADIPINFLTNADTTGGNSGSPVMNGRGELVGINFDSTYESITKDWHFNGEITRAIHVDVRYMLWLLEEVEKADHIIKEMTIVN